MSLKSKCAAAVAASLFFVNTAFACDIMVQDAYVRSARPNAPTGAAFMVVMNHSDQDDRLIGAHTSVAKKTELHTHKDNGEGIMQMVEIKEGINIPAGEKHILKRGGDHVMLMGLTQELVQGESISLTLEFEKAGAVQVDVPVDNMRKPQDPSAHSHSGHSSD